MPKIIQDAKEKILSAAREEIKESGFSNLGIRQISKRSGIAIGTIYHYFPDKVHLIAELMFENWMDCETQALDDIAKSTTTKESFQIIYRSILSFRDASVTVFNTYRDKYFSDYYFKEHPMFVKQISAMIEKTNHKYLLGLSDSETTLLAELFISSVGYKEIKESDFILIVMKWLNQKGE